MQELLTIFFEKGKVEKKILLWKELLVMTRKLYYEDSHIRHFTAKVLSCEQGKEHYEVVLDQTAFFPGGGGQLPDTGGMNMARVVGAKEVGEDVVHYVTAPMTVGSMVECRLNWNQRLRRMQNHSGEHVLSGIIHSKYGFENVGFHMGDDFITVDYSGELGAGQVYEIERECNLAIAANVPITCTFPDKATLDAMEYRSKKELQGAVRIVNVEGYDTCACCAPHVHYTGQIGMIKIYSWARHRGGTRLTMLCGMDALDDYNARCANISAISGLLSAKPMEVSQATARLWKEHEELKYKLNGLYMKLTENKIAALEETEGNLVLFESDLDMDNLRNLMNAAKDKCTGIAAGFIGDDENGYRYIIASKAVDLRAKSKEINAAIDGKGGGQKEMIQGTAKASEAVIRKYFVG